VGERPSKVGLNQSHARFNQGGRALAGAHDGKRGARMLLVQSHGKDLAYLAPAADN
jgi:hypothetical protein